MMPMLHGGAVLLLSGTCLSLGCDKLSGKETSETDADEPSTAVSDQLDSASAEASAAAVPAASAEVVLAPGRSQVPSLEEWNAVGEVTVKGSSALSCETKMVREWFRVSCRGKNDSGGTPTGLKVLRGGKGEAMTFSSGGVTSLVMPFVEGTDFAAVFSWSDKSHELVVKWPRGAPKPPIIGVFEGAKSPLDGTAGDQNLQDKLCTCFKKVRKTDSCAGIMGMPDPDCDRTYGDDCAKLLACARGEPGAWPSCKPGFKNGGAIGRCMRDCSGGKACPSGSHCSKEWGEVCWED